MEKNIQQKNKNINIKKPPDKGGFCFEPRFKNYSVGISLNTVYVMARKPKNKASPYTPITNKSPFTPTKISKIEFRIFILSFI